MKRPLFSVLLAVRNGAPFVGDAVRSILGQTERDLELLVLENGSSDRSLSVARKAANGDKRFRGYHLRAAGLYSALNQGLSLARGELISHMDADDKATPRCLEWQAEALRAYPEVDVVGGDMRQMGSPRTIFVSPKEPDEIAATALFATVAPHPTICFRKNVPKKFGKYSRAYAYAEDYDLFSRWLRQGVKFRGIDKVLGELRIHENQTTSINQKNHLLQVRKVRERWLGYLGIKPTPNEMDLHESLASAHWPLDKRGLSDTESWLLRLATRNSLKKVFPEKAFEHIIVTYWIKTVLANLQHGYGFFGVLEKLASSSLNTIPYHISFKKILNRQLRRLSTDQRVGE